MLENLTILKYQKIYTLLAIRANRHQKRAANAAIGNKIWQTLPFKEKPIGG